MDIGANEAWTLGQRRDGSEVARGAGPEAPADSISRRRVPQIAAFAANGAHRSDAR